MPKSDPNAAARKVIAASWQAIWKSVTAALAPFTPGSGAEGTIPRDAHTGPLDPRIGRICRAHGLRLPYVGKLYGRFQRASQSLLNTVGGLETALDAYETQTTIRVRDEDGRSTFAAHAVHTKPPHRGEEDARQFRQVASLEEREGIPLAWLPGRRVELESTDAEPVSRDDQREAVRQVAPIVEGAGSPRQRRRLAAALRGYGATARELKVKLRELIRGDIDPDPPTLPVHAGPRSKQPK